MSEVTILLVDDHPVVREGYRRLLERQAGFRVVAEAETAAEAYRLFRETAPSVVVMDLSLGGPSGLEAIRNIRQWDGQARILVFTMHQGSAFALKAFEAGAAGYVTKSSAPSELVAAVTAVARGRQAVSADIAQELAAERLAGKNSPLDDLAPREVEILRLVASGMATEAIAEALHLSPKTVQNYHYGIKAKLGARNDAHLVWLAASAGVLGAGFRFEP
ncbi:response regulator [Methylorubrum extorquens]|uniref:Response regulator Input and output domains: CheY and HTH LuxR family n=1 Tax=Methylorubrum extorquens (strain ATCC 14718 / DSM 1338 / JCM 2805 / NCIMB 9133 / AM1) TaxID=272630 RepID=C5ATJ1_METEA|nr:response regulator transcription factor [Methylorubrum extorquens]ACS40515.1 putative response regulator; Input and output domains: CheY and HTH LuxR family [Methylorubrum extorquens AM1]MCP1541333.1 DNA-binding NarL/FixJ family response regulator [Methylorubrum extorquens]MCP1586131.1 DNA-binding NarL/FixJ family response regulator [Methylorubrum extorquens]